MVSLKLETILQQAQSADEAELTQLIRNVLDAPGIYTFAELLLTPSVQNLNSTQPSVYKLLEIFAYGTLQDYKSHQSTLPPLTTGELQKLRLLTLVSLVSNSHRVLNYDVLQTSLEISDMRTLEDLIIEGIYDNVLEGTLDQRNRELHVERTLARDVHPSQTQAIVSSLRSWAETTHNVLTQLDRAFQSIKTRSDDYKLSTTLQKEQLEHLVSRMKGKRLASLDGSSIA